MSLTQEQIAYACRTLHSGKATICDTCGQTVKVYPRKITCGMARAVMLMHVFDKQSPNEWLKVEDHIKKYGVGDRDFHKLRFWGIIEKKFEARDDGSSRNGLYRITEYGKAFVRGEISVPKTVYVYNDEVLYVTDGKEGRVSAFCTIRDALGRKFDYEELMGRR